jgi:hypothetical protein
MYGAIVLIDIERPESYSRILSLPTGVGIRWPKPIIGTGFIRISLISILKTGGGESNIQGY